MGEALCSLVKEETKELSSTFSSAQWANVLMVVEGRTIFALRPRAGCHG